jgi:hypothetical protein
MNLNEKISNRGRIDRAVHPGKVKLRGQGSKDAGSDYSGITTSKRINGVLRRDHSEDFIYWALPTPSQCAASSNKESEEALYYISGEPRPLRLRIVGQGCNGSPTKRANIGTLHAH